MGRALADAWGRPRGDQSQACKDSSRCRSAAFRRSRSGIARASRFRTPDLVLLQSFLGGVARPPNTARRITRERRRGASSASRSRHIPRSVTASLERDHDSSNRDPSLHYYWWIMIPHYWWSMIPAFAGTSLFRKPASTPDQAGGRLFRDHAPNIASLTRVMLTLRRSPPVGRRIIWAAGVHPANAVPDPALVVV